MSPRLAAYSSIAHLNLRNLLCCIRKTEKCFFSLHRGPYTSWYHSQCAPWTSIPSVNYLDGYHQMKAADKKVLKDLCEGRGSRPRMLGAGPSAGGSSSSAVMLASGRSWTPLPAQGSPGIDWDSINDETREDTDVLYSSIDLLVVGCRYYSGMLYRGEMADLVREPANPYDPNAIRCDNIHGSQVGHIKREQVRSTFS